MSLIRCLGVKLGIVDYSIGICLTIVSFCLTVKKLLFSKVAVPFIFWAPKSLQMVTAAAAAAAKSLQSCLTLCNPIDDSSPGSPVPGILPLPTPKSAAHTAFS